jgi:glutamate--cysteine ligase
MVRSWSLDQCLDLYRDVVRSGLQARMRKIAVQELAAELGSIAAEGLRRQDRRDDRGRTEAVYLEPTLELVQGGLWPGVSTAREWTGEPEGRLKRLVEQSQLQADIP